MILWITPLNKNKKNTFRMSKVLIKQDYNHMKSITLKLLEKQQSKIDKTSSFGQMNLGSVALTSDIAIRRREHGGSLEEA